MDLSIHKVDYKQVFTKMFEKHGRNEIGLCFPKSVLSLFFILALATFSSFGKALFEFIKPKNTK